MKIPWNRELAIAALSIAAIAAHVALRFGPPGAPRDLPLLVALVLGGVPLVWTLLGKLVRREFGSDLIAGVSIVTAVLLEQYLAGTLVVLMLSGGEALEAYAVRSASSVLRLLAKRMPAVAHRRRDGALEDIPLDQIRVGDVLQVFPHETCPVDGTVVDGHGVMDEAYLTGEPYKISKTPGSAVISGSINGETVLTLKADKLAVDSRYAKIMQVMRDSEQSRPKLRRIGDQLGAIYTPIALVLAGAAWAWSGDPLRFLAVMVVATPCPLLIGIPVAIIGSISLAARRGIIVKDPAVLEKISTCRTAIFDKTGTLTYGEPVLTETRPCPGFLGPEVLGLAASLERYSKHPLALSVVKAAERARAALHEADEISEKPGEGLRGTVDGRRVEITHRKHILTDHPALAGRLPPAEGGMEAVVLVDDQLAAVLRFRDEPKAEGRQFIGHLGRKHGFERVMIVSGDRESEVTYLAEKVGITEVYFSQTPEQKLERVRQETARAPTVFMGDGINDAPAMTAATVGVAFGKASDVTGEAAGVVILDSSLQRADEFLHIGHRMRRIALQSAVGGMIVSVGGMLLAFAGLLPPVAGAITQEIIDVAAVLNALRAAWPPRALTDYEG